LKFILPHEASKSSSAYSRIFLFRRRKHWQNAMASESAIAPL